MRPAARRRSVQPRCCPSGTSFGSGPGSIDGRSGQSVAEPDRYLHGHDRWDEADDRGADAELRCNRRVTDRQRRRPLLGAGRRRVGLDRPPPEREDRFVRRGDGDLLGVDQDGHPQPEDATLAASRKYTVFLSGGITDAAGNPFADHELVVHDEELTRWGSRPHLPWLVEEHPAGGRVSARQDGFSPSRAIAIARPPTFPSGISRWLGQERAGRSSTRSSSVAVVTSQKQATATG